MANTTNTTEATEVQFILETVKDGKKKTTYFKGTELQVVELGTKKRDNGEGCVTITFSDQQMLLTVIPEEEVLIEGTICPYIGHTSVPALIVEQCITNRIQEIIHTAYITEESVLSIGNMYEAEFETKTEIIDDIVYEAGRPRCKAEMVNGNKMYRWNDYMVR